MIFLGNKGIGQASSSGSTRQRHTHLIATLQWFMIPDAVFFTSFDILGDIPEKSSVLQPPPVNCTATPSNPVCHNVIVPPAPSPHVAPKPSPPHNGPTVQPPKPSPPTVQPPKASPPTVQPPKASPPQATPPSEPTSIPTIQPISPTSVPSATPQPALPPTVNTVTPLSSSTPVVTAGPPMLPMPTLTVTPQGPLQSTAISYGRRLMQVARPQQ